MATYTYTNENVKYEDLQAAILNEGLSDCTYNMKGNGDSITLETSGTQAQADNIIANATTGSLFANKQQKIRDVKENSSTLLALGIESWSAGDYVACDKQAADGYYTDYEFYSTHASKLSATTPYVATTLTGGVVSTSSASDINTLAEDCADRLIYLYTASSNSDGSKSELALITAILTAANQTALDAITDTRS